MPYSKKRYGSKSKWKKYKSCVRKVKSGVRNPYAVCRKTIFGKKRGKK